MDLDALRFANFKQLDDAVEDWGHIVRNLKDLAEDAEKGLHQAANKADWAGENSQVTKEFIGKTAGEFQDAHTQAQTIHNILSDTAGELKGYQKQLNEALDRGLKKNLTVMDTGDGSFTVTMNVHPDRAAAGYTPPEHDEQDVTALKNEVEKILTAATKSDNSAKTVLTAIVDQTEYGFSDATYKDRDTAEAAVEEADSMAALAKKNPEKLTPEEFDRLSAGLKKYADDPLFAERFATDLGPDKTLEFWAGINDPHKAAQLGQARVDQYADLQRSLGMTLATASHSDSAAMTQWKGRMISIGDDPVGGQMGPMGFQVMSNLMRAGDYDDQFLKSYGTSLMATERKLTGNGEHANLAWQHMGVDPWLNRMGDDSGDDPLTGYLKALSSSPDAATEFLNEEYLPKGGDHKEAVSNFTYLFEDREWPKETDLKGDDIHPGQNNLAMAIEAATTGHPAGELPTADTPAHNAQQAKLMASVVASISDDPDRLTEHSYMSDSIGQMASEYLPDINRASTDVKPDPNSADWKQIEKLFPVAGSSAAMDHADVSRFLIAVGQNPEGYSAVEVGQKAYMANLMDYHMNPDLPADHRYGQNMENTITEISRRSAEVGGCLAIGRQEAVLGPAKEADDAYNHAVSQWQNVANGVVGTGIGVGTSFIATPAVGAVAGGAAGTVSSVVLGELFQDVEGSKLEDSGLTSAQLWEDSRERNIALAQKAATEAAKAHHVSYADQVGEWARYGTQDGFNDASTDGRRMADDLETEIS
ncbi:hypothetical protein SAMN05428944_2375 [Streptomyces sp. 1222.5]|uniref:hypothetical protein n=1 Tax=unclassified Streptomyces TaxID=2593676 RepID=UPI000894AAB6|nr:MULTISPECIES: hypothetical protein [unclassified Streptomyces]PKW10437.1 hypothetical protein BX260_5719 [Streptomyces sp. 5112.2]SEC06146.1 hypothetical protein SAMN05428944_2375 [Streptomyces sp. 1222.5]